MGDKASAEKISQSDCEHEYKRAGIETPGVCDTSYGNLLPSLRGLAVYLSQNAIKN